MQKTMESIMIFANEDTMKQIKESEKDIKTGKIRNINSVKNIHFHH